MKIRIQRSRGRVDAISDASGGLRAGADQGLCPEPDDERGRGDDQPQDQRSRKYKGLVWRRSHEVRGIIRLANACRGIRWRSDESSTVLVFGRLRGSGTTVPSNVDGRRLVGLRCVRYVFPRSFHSGSSSTRIGGVGAVETLRGTAGGREDSARATIPELAAQISVRPGRAAKADEAERGLCVTK